MLEQSICCRPSSGMDREQRTEFDEDRCVSKCNCVVGLLRCVTLGSARPSGRRPRFSCPVACRCRKDDLHPLCGGRHPHRGAGASQRRDQVGGRRARRTSHALLHHGSRSAYCYANRRKLLDYNIQNAARYRVRHASIPEVSKHTDHQRIQNKAAARDRPAAEYPGRIPTVRAWRSLCPGRKPRANSHLQSTRPDRGATSHRSTRPRSH